MNFNDAICAYYGAVIVVGLVCGLLGYLVGRFYR
jgi:hypothetical protein